MTAIYAGTFDPITRGHVDIIRRARAIFDKVIIAIGENPAKKTLFTLEERALLITEVTGAGNRGNPHLSVLAFSGLLAKLCESKGVNVIVRGLRALTDFEYELAMAHANKVLAPKVETIFIPTAPELSFVSSSAAREIARFGGDVNEFVHPAVADALKAKFGAGSGYHAKKA